MRILLATATLMVCAGCASSLPTISSTAPISPKRVIVATTGDACAFIIRDRRRVGSGSEYRVSLDGVEIARIAIGEHVRICSSPGDHLLEVRNPRSRVSGAGDARPWKAAAGSPAYFRISTSSGSIKLAPTTEQSATG